MIKGVKALLNLNIYFVASMKDIYIIGTQYNLKNLFKTFVTTAFCFRARLLFPIVFLWVGNYETGCN